MFAGKSKKKINGLQKGIDELNKGLKTIAEKEKYYLDAAARELASARKYEGVCGGIIVTGHIQRKGILEQTANYIAGFRPLVLSELVLLESLKRKEMEALQDGAENRTRRFCFFF